MKSEYDMPKLSLRQIYLDALGKRSPEARAAYLEEVCGSDDELKSKVEALLREAVDDGFLEIPAAHLQITEALPLPESPGSVIGRYKLLQKLGEGGCGAVYMAEQTEPVRRRVALKVIKLGMDTKAVIARFEAERQALALMDHPNIAKVLDAGSTDSGRPYFVMELVRGIRITDYCDQNKLDTKQRLELFIQICQAIQHAHQKGIIHRDIKPSNILVTLHDGIPVPKVIDFGIAKATTGQQLTDKTLFTAYEQFIGTPAYMSPEQAEMSGLDIDTRSDIYSLGVLLYELLTGRTPFDGRELLSLGIDAMRKTIREQEPPRPSMKLHTLQGAESTTTAQAHGAEMPRLIHLLRGDLDWIVMRCLEKDRVRRYDTANGLAMDIQRHLKHEPVIARPPSKLYELQKAVRRHKVGFAATAAVMLALTVGITLALWQARVAWHERRIAEAKEQTAVAAQASEEKQRTKAQAAERTARQQAYASDMNVAKQALKTGNFGRALDLLNQQRPKPDEIDLRGWEWRYLWKQTRGDALFPLCRNPGAVTSLAVSADGNWLAVSDTDQAALSLWDLRTRQKLTSIPLAARGMVRAAFSPTEPLLAFASSASAFWPPYTLHVWNVATQQMMAEEPLDGFCEGLAFSKDGRTVVTSTCNKGHITFWHTPDLAPVKPGYPSEQATFGPSTSFAVSPDLSLAACGLAGGRIRVIDLQDGHELWTEKAVKDFVTTLAFSQDGKILASAGGFTASDSDIHLWDAVTGRKIGLLEGHKRWVGSLVFWPDGKKLASGSGDQTIRIWNVAEPSEPRCRDVLRGHRNEVWRLALMPDGRTLVSGCKDGTVCLWDTSVRHAKPPCITIPGSEFGWCFTSDSRSVLTLNFDGQVMRWNGDDFQQSTPVLNIGSSFYMGLFSRDGRYLATGSTNGVLSVWDVSRRALSCKLSVQGELGVVKPVRFYSQGRKLLTQSRDHRLSAWDLDAKQRLYSWNAPAIPRTGPNELDYRAAIGISPDSTHALVIGWGGQFLYADLTDGSETALNLQPVNLVSDADFSPDGKFFAVSSHLSLLQVWDTDTWQEAHPPLGGYVQGLYSMAFSPDGKRLVSGGDGDEALRFWDTQSWRDVLTLESDSADFWDTHFSPDGNIIGSVDVDGTLQLWRAPSWKEIEAVETAAASSGGQP